MSPSLGGSSLPANNTAADQATNCQLTGCCCRFCWHLAWPDPSLLGSLLSFPCLLIVFLFYTISFSAIQLPDKTKHAIINTCLVLMMLVTGNFFLFSTDLGLKQISRPLYGQLCLIFLLFLATCTLFWFLFKVHLVYQSFRQHRLRQRAVQGAFSHEQQHHQHPGAESSSKNNKNRSLLWSYFAVYGLSLVLVFISVLLEVASGSFSTELNMHSVTPRAVPGNLLFVPFALLSLVILTGFLVMHFQMKGTSMGKQDAVRPAIVSFSGIESDLPLKSELVVQINNKSGLPINDQELTYRGQLTYLSVMYSFFLLMSISMTFASVVKPLEKQFGSQAPVTDHVLFSSLYSCFACILSFYMLNVFCVRRKKEFRRALQKVFHLKAKNSNNSEEDTKNKKAISETNKTTNQRLETKLNRNSCVLIINNDSASVETKLSHQEKEQFVIDYNTGRYQEEQRLIKSALRAKNSDSRSPTISPEEMEKQQLLIKQFNNRSKSLLYPYASNDLNLPQLLDADCSLSQATDGTFLNPRLNAIAKRFFEKSRTRQQQSKLLVERNNLNQLDSKSDFGGRPIKCSLAPKLTNCSQPSKARSEIIAFSKCNQPEEAQGKQTRKECEGGQRCRCPSSRSPRKRSGRDYNLYSSSPHVADGLVRESRPVSSKSSRARGRQAETTSRNIGTQFGGDLSKERCRDGSVSACGQSDILSAVSQPWSHCSKRSCPVTPRRVSSSSHHRREKESRHGRDGSARVSSHGRDRAKCTECSLASGLAEDDKSPPLQSSRGRRHHHIKEPHHHQQQEKRPKEAVAHSAASLQGFSPGCNAGPETPKKHRRRSSRSSDKSTFKSLSSQKRAANSTEKIVDYVEIGGLIEAKKNLPLKRAIMVYSSSD